jgi:uncharacterized protein with von Willebrand factor type A (vWA) domain
MDANNKENLGPAETIIQSLLTYSDHLYHGRPGVVVRDPRSAIGLQWAPVTHKDENGARVVYRLEKAGKKTVRTRLGTMNGDNKIRNGAAEVGTYRPSGLFPEVASWFYKQVANVWQLDNEFAARWASFAFNQEHRDLKVVLAAFLLVQSRKGDPVLEGDEVLFADEDYRDVGEAMLLLQEKGKDLNPKLLLRIWDVLNLPEVAKINHELGFGKSAKHPFLGRWPKTIEKWLRYREENPKMLEGLVKAGFRTTIMTLARRIGYRPTTDRFFAALRWKQKQADDGRREMAIGKAVKAAESWEHLDEARICEVIMKTKPNWKRIVGLLPTKVGVTRAVVAAAIEAGSLSDKDIIILTPTLEELGLLKVQEIKERLASALAKADDMRAANIARNVRSKELKETLEAGADKVAQKVVEEVTRGIRVYFMVDISGSMQGALEAAKPLIAKFLQSFPLDRVHVSTFNTAGREVAIKHASTKGVEAAFRGISAGGGTEYGAGVRALEKHKPAVDEDALFIFVGDEEARPFPDHVVASGLKPVAFGFYKTVPNGGAAAWRQATYGADNNTAVRETANRLGIPCFLIDERTFDDPYAVPRTIRALVAATPVGQTPAGQQPRVRVTLVDQILQTPLLSKPQWA